MDYQVHGLSFTRRVFSLLALGYRSISFGGSTYCKIFPGVACKFSSVQFSKSICKVQLSKEKSVTLRPGRHETNTSVLHVHFLSVVSGSSSTA